MASHVEVYSEKMPDHFPDGPLSPKLKELAQQREVLLAQTHGQITDLGREQLPADAKPLQNASPGDVARYVYGRKLADASNVVARVTKERIPFESLA